MLKRDWTYRGGRYQREPALWPWALLLAAAVLAWCVFHWGGP